LRSIVILLILPLVLIISVYMVSFVPVVYNSVLDPATGQLTLSSYSQSVTPAYLGTTFVTTLRVSVYSTALAVIMGYPLAYFAVQHKSHHVRKLIVFAAITVFFVNSVVKSFSWYILLEKYGVVNAILGLIGAPAQSLLFTEPAVVIGATQFLLPFVVLLLIGPVQAVKPELVDAARNMGADDIRLFLRVILPLTMPGIVNAAFLSFILGLGVFIAPLILGGGFVTTMALLIYDLIVNAFQYNLGAAITVFFTAFTLLMAFLINRMVSLRYSRSE
jgi:ABC-type spermidine/putrescine transport system permease subunit I